MNACFGNLRGKPRAELEALAQGIGTEDECTVTGAQLILAHEDREREWREIIDTPDTTERLRRYRRVEAARERLDW